MNFEEQLKTRKHLFLKLAEFHLHNTNVFSDDFS